jgi:DNA-binding SARP family transcriptional activator/tetratricopeptide (TPR) repeat protein
MDRPAQLTGAVRASIPGGGSLLEFQILGPLAIVAADGPVRLGHRREQRVLAALLLDANRLVPLSRLVDAVWDDPPPTAAKAVRNAVSSLRAHLGGSAEDADRDGPIVTHTAGYLLRVGDGQLDAHVFEQRLAAVRRLTAVGRRDAALVELRAALGLWRGPALAGLGGSLLEAAAAGLNERRLTALEERVALELSLGAETEPPVELIEELTGLVADNPLRERLRGLLMRALYRTGRRTDALLAYREGRRIMVRELGLEPGPELRRLEQAVLTDDPLLVQPARPRTNSTIIPAQLPADVTAFIGRGSQLELLDRALESASQDGRRTGPVIISAIAGTPGVGKTALAVHWAHLVRDRFPDGQLHVDLRGYSAGLPRRPIDALTTFLNALEVPPDQIPVDVESAAALYRTLLSDRRMLVLLDNAAGPDQVRPLLPGSPGCLVLITSRDRLAGLVARESASLITLDVLTAAEAENLLAGIIGRRRTEAEPAATAELAAACARLPLALRIAAASLVSQPHRGIADYVAALRGGNRLATLQIENDDQAAVRAAFDQSYATLGPDARLMFRRLGLLPGKDVTAAAAGELVAGELRDSVDPGAADRVLDRLAAAHLVRRGPTGRVSFHDLLRSYAAEMAVAEDSEAQRTAAVERLYAFYLGRVGAAARLLYAPSLRLQSHADADPGVFAGAPDALAWLDAELPNLVAAVLYAAEHGFKQAAVLLADGMRGYFHLRRGSGADWFAVAGAALTAATADGDLRGQAAAQLSLADANQRQSRYEASMAHFAAALVLFDQAGWPDGRGVVLGNLGFVYWQIGQLDRAVENISAALEVTRETGRLVGTAMNLDNLGAVHREQGRLPEARRYSEAALAIHRDIGSTLGEAIALTSLAEAELLLGDLDAAGRHAELALTKLQETGDRGMETEVLRVLAMIHRDRGSLDTALEYARAAVTLSAETGDRRIEAGALTTLGTLEQRLFQHTEALAHHRAAVDLAHRIAAGYQEAEALLELAAAEQHLGRSADARACAHRAVTLARPAGFRLLEARALVLLAEGHQSAGEPIAARALAAQALSLLDGCEQRPEAAAARRLAEQS